MPETHNFQAPEQQLVTAGGETYSYTPFTVRMPNGPKVKQVLTNQYPSNTIDSAGNDTDINLIMERFSRTGILPEATQQPQYGDVVDLQGDLTEIHQRAREALDIAQKFATAWKPREEIQIDPTTPSTEPLQSSPPA